MEYKKPEIQLRNLLTDIVEMHIDRNGIDSQIEVSDIDEDKELNLAILIMKNEDKSSAFFADNLQNIEHLLLKLIIGNGEVIEDCRLALSDLLRHHFHNDIQKLLEDTYIHISTEIREEQGLHFHTDPQTGEGVWK
jgi:hypothetical protein